MLRKVGVSAGVVISVFCTPLIGYALTQAEIDAQRQQLKDEIVQKELEIQAERMKLLNLKNTREGYEEQAALLEKQIAKATASIKQRELAIKGLDNEVAHKEENIEELSAKYKRESASLAQLLRKTREYDDVSLAELILSNERLSEAFADIDQFDTIKAAIQGSFQEITETQGVLRTEQQQLEDAKNDQEELKMIQIQERADTSVQKSKQDSLARQTKVAENAKAQTIADKEKEVDAIRARLFALRDSDQDVSFGTMLGYAQEASKKTDVAPALILAILTVETNLGQNLGTGKWYEDMHPTRDVPVFKEIVAELGLNPDSMPVSARPCSLAERQAVGPGKPCGYGYGGAMGPAQFIPSTWVLYKDRIARLSGQNPPNPWDPRTAVFATALLLMDNGADTGTRTAEHKAAVRYLAGWRNAEKAEYWWYGDKTMAYRDEYQQNIDTLAGN